MKDAVKTYEGLIEANPLVSKIVNKDMAEGVFAGNKHTVDTLSPLWNKNIKQNLHLYKKHGSFVDSFKNFGTNKAVIMVGAGPSFNKNKNVLKKIYELNCKFKFDDQPFIIVASNKMFKPLLEMGIYPHFTVLIDAGEVLYPQLCEKVPHWAKESILITGLHTSPKILSKWDRSGGEICFYLIGEDEEKKGFEKEIGEDPERIHIQQGGNVINTFWILSHRVLNSHVYIIIGNDLGFKYSSDEKERQESFYAVGDYRTNILNKRNEAQSKFAWMGYDLYESCIVENQLMYDLTPMGISPQMWIYKTWLEVQATLWADQKKFMICNASEAGTLGVLYRSYDPGAIEDRNNCYLIDEILPKSWETTTLARACNKFLEVKRCQTQMAIENAAASVIG